jgi:hypothetical protein
MNTSDAELGLVSALLMHPFDSEGDALNRVAALKINVGSEHFEDPLLGEAFEVITQNARESVAVSPLLLAQIMENRLNMTGAEPVSQPSAVQVYAREVVRHYNLRRLGSVGQQALNTGADTDPELVASELLQQLTGLDSGEERYIHTATESTRLFLDELARDQENIRSGHVGFDFNFFQGRDTSGVTRFPVREMIPMIMGGWVILLTAGTKVGKSTLGWQLAEWNVAENGLRGVYFHFEDPPKMINYRRVARRGLRVDQSYDPSLKTMLGSVLRPEQLEKIGKVYQEVSTWGDRLTEVYCAGWTMEQVVRTLHRLHLQQPVDFWIIDYLNKATLSPKKLRDYGVFVARGQDVELVKNAAEQTGTVAVLIQQDIDGKPYETNASIQKSQVWLRIQRDIAESDGRMMPQGDLIIERANMGATGRMPITLVTGPLVWIYGKRYDLREE